MQDNKACENTDTNSCPVIQLIINNETMLLTITFFKTLFKSIQLIERLKEERLEKLTEMGKLFQTLLVKVYSGTATTLWLVEFITMASCA